MPKYKVVNPVGDKLHSSDSWCACSLWIKNEYKGDEELEIKLEDDVPVDVDAVPESS